MLLCDEDMRGPWQTSFGLQPVESELHGGKGLSVGQVNGKIEGEERGKQDAGQKATTSVKAGEPPVGKSSLKELQTAG